MRNFEIGIVGLGAMGSMAALQLARRGRRVIGFDRFHPPHPFGSSHGKSRIIREAYFEHPQYVPLVQRAYRLWADLEAAAGRRLLVTTGGLMIGPPESALVAGARRSALTHRLPYQELLPDEVGRRFPMFRLEAHEVALFEPRAGVLFPEPAVEAALQLAGAAGAELHFDEPVTAWTAGESITVRTRTGHVGVDRLILCGGAWMGDLARTELPLQVARQVLFWFTAPEAPGPDTMPVFIWEWSPGRMFYGFPDLGEGVKLAIHHQGEPADPDLVRRTVQPGEADRLLEIMTTRMPALVGPPAQSAVCLYTNAPDGDFILDRHPDDPRVLLASPCSGHGFKFAPVIGEVLADLAEDRLPAFGLEPFRLARFTP